MLPEKDAKDPRFVAAIDLIGKAGARQLQIRFQDDEQPVVWVVAAEYPSPEGWHWEAAGAMTPLVAAIRLLEATMDGGGVCAHCGRRTGVWTDWEITPPFEKEMCWYVFDPELEKFRRSCEGDDSRRLFGRDPLTGKVVGRNDPCPCGSGRKWKRCHGMTGAPAEG